MIHSTKVEIIWTVIPVIILVLMAVPAARTLIKLEDASGTDITIKVTAYQWKWQYEYLNENVSFFSSLDRVSDEARQRDATLKPEDVPNYLLEVDNPMVVPVGAKVRLLLTVEGRHPRLVGARARRQEGRHPGRHQRNLVRDHA